MVGYLGYDVVREIEHLPNVPHDDAGLPDAVLSLTGHVTAFDHFRQRLCLIENVFLDDGQGSDDEIDAAYDRACARLDDLVDELARPLPYTPSPPPADELFELPAVTSSMGGDLYRGAVEVAREHILAGDAFQIVLAQRFDLEGELDPFDVYRVLRQVNPSPYMYVVRHPSVTLVGSSPEPMVQLLDGRVIIRPIAGRGSGAGPRSTTDDSPPSSARTRRSGPSTSCSSTWPATTSDGSSSSGPSTWKS